MAPPSPSTSPASSTGKATGVKPVLPLLFQALLLLLSTRGLAEARTFEASPDGTPYSIASALAEGEQRLFIINKRL